MAARPALIGARALSAASASSSRPPLQLCSYCIRRSRYGPPAVPPRRSFSSSQPGRVSIKSFFTPTKSSRAPIASSSSNPHSDFLLALSTKDVNSLRTAYDALLQQLSQTGTTPLTLDELTLAMQHLSSRKASASLTLLKRMYVDMPSWGFDRERRHLKLVVAGMCRVGRVSDALRWTKRERDVSNMTIWRMILRAAIRYQPEFVTELEGHLRDIAGEAGLGSTDYGLLLRDLRYNTPTPAETKERLATLLKEMEERVVRLDRDGEAELVAVYLSMGDLNRAGKIVRTWEDGLGMVSTVQRTAVEETAKDDNETEEDEGLGDGLASMDESIIRNAALWNTTIDYHIARGDTQAIQDTMRRMTDAGFKSYDNGLRFILVRAIEDRLQHSPDVVWTDITDIVDSVESTCGAKTTSPIWGAILNLISNDLDLTMRIYDEIRARGTSISSEIARAMIIPLCSPTPPDLRTALDVYGDMISAGVSISSSRVRSRLLAIYSELFRAYSDLPSADPTIPTRLLGDMGRIGLSLPPNVLTSIAVSIIRSSPDHTAAFNAYAHLYALDPAALTDKAYTVIITAFIGHATPTSPFAPAALVSEMIADMRKAGFSPGSHILTSLFAAYGQRASALQPEPEVSTTTLGLSGDPMYRRNHSDSLYKAISHFHDMLKLGSTIEPDIPLLNAMMDAYSRVEAYSSALEVWDLLVERRASEPKETLQAAYGPSVSIILDTCGRAGLLSRARRIWAWAKRHKLDGPGTKVWEGWVECLCRTGRIGEAADMVINREVGEAGVSVAMMEILLKFSWRDKAMIRTVPDRVKEAFPEMWDQVRGLVETRRTRERGD